MPNHAPATMLRALAKQLYAAIPFKQPLYKIIRRVASPLPERLYRHLHFKGVITIPVNSERQFRIMHHGYMIENELFWRGLQGWEKVSMELWNRLCQQAQCIVDIGANTGVYALVAQAINPAATVIAVEPVARIYAKLQANVALNGSRIKAVHAAVSDHTGTATLYDMPECEHVLSVSLEKQWNSESTRLRPVTVPCITVADLLKQFATARADLLKIDVETHEAAVLRGFRSILVRDKPSLLIEILNDAVAEEVTGILGGMGYQYYNIDDVTWPPPRVNQLAKSKHFNFLVCQPAVSRAIGL